MLPFSAVNFSINYIDEAMQYEHAHIIQFNIRELKKLKIEKQV